MNINPNAKVIVCYGNSNTWGDIPDKEKDAKLAQHVLETRLNPKMAEPLIPLNFIRKYIVP